MRAAAGTHRVLLTAATLLLLGANPVVGQAPEEPAACSARPDWPFEPPAVSPLEPRTRLSPVRIDRGDRVRWVGLVDLGDRFPFWLERPACPDGGPEAEDRGGLRQAEESPGAADTDAPPVGDRPALAASVAGGAFSRFDLESSQNDFIEVHYRVGLRLLARLGALEARAELYHVSSHLGDEVLERTGRAPISTSREGVEVLVSGRPVDGLRVYGGPGVVLRSSRDFDAASLRGGLAWEPAARWGAFRPYAGIEAFAWQELGWEPAAAAEAGLRFGGGRYRLALTAGAGPSRAEQFFRESETLLGLTVSADF